MLNVKNRLTDIIAAASKIRSHKDNVSCTKPLETVKLVFNNSHAMIDEENEWTDGTIYEDCCHVCRNVPEQDSWFSQFFPGFPDQRQTDGDIFIHLSSQIAEYF